MDRVIVHESLTSKYWCECDNNGNYGEFPANCNKLQSISKNILNQLKFITFLHRDVLRHLFHFTSSFASTRIKNDRFSRVIINNWGVEQKYNYCASYVWMNKWMNVLLIVVFVRALNHAWKISRLSFPFQCQLCRVLMLIWYLVSEDQRETWERRWVNKTQRVKRFFF